MSRSQFFKLVVFLNFSALVSLHFFLQVHCLSSCTDRAIACLSIHLQTPFLGEAGCVYFSIQSHSTDRFVLTGSHAGEAAEIFGEERGVGKVHLLSYLCRRLVSVAQFYFYAGDEGAVYPIFGSGTAGLADDGAQISLCETHAPGIVAYLVMFVTMLGDQLEEAVEDGLLA